MSCRAFLKLLLVGIYFWLNPAFAGTEGVLHGTVQDNDQVAIGGAKVKVLNSSGTVVKETQTSATGEFSVSPIDFGPYTIDVQAPGYSSYRTEISVSSSAVANLTATLSRGEAKEMVMKVSAKRRNTVQNGTSSSSVQITKEDVEDLPQGEQISLPKLITSTTPGVVPGAFGQMFFRGNHANIQYQIDGVQLPESPSNTFGDAFTPRNIDHMEIITGGIPAEYGQRLSAVINIISKTGPETPGGSAELNYGSFDTFSPTVTYGGSTADGNLHYYFSANYNRTDRGLDTPNPTSAADVTSGGPDIVHDYSNGNNEFAKVDWIADNRNKLSFIAFNNYKYLQIPTFPASFPPTSAIFTSSDSYGNNPYVYYPPTLGDSQNQEDTYIEAVWKHTFSESAFLQVAPYYKLSQVNVIGDPTNDLAGATAVATQPGVVYDTFSENRTVNNFGLKSDFTLRPNDWNLIKAGFQLQASMATGSFTIQTQASGAAAPSAPFMDSTPNNGYFEGVYAQDDLTIVKPLVLNAGLRYDATQFNLGPGTNPTDGSLQPRIGLNYSPWETTKLHVFYGKLFQPAPVENLREAFVAVSGGTPAPYDIKAEKSDFYEVGIAQEIPAINHVISVNTYRKNSQNLLDDSQLLNTAISQPVNFSNGFVYGTEVSIKGQIMDGLTDYLNYSYVIAQGRGLSGGIFTLPVGQSAGGSYQYLDHAQMHTLNAGATYKYKHMWATLQGLFGSGLRTGPSNTLELPHHFTMDATVGYEFHGDSWWNSGLKVSADVLNMFDNRYPISVANGFNGSHYAPGIQFYGHIVKEL